MFLLARYGVQTSISFPLIKAGVRDFATSSDYTVATGDTKISKDGGNVANTTNNPSAVGGTGSIDWTLTLTATELQCAVADIQIVDSATKAVEDQFLKVYTYGNASAKIPVDLSDTVRLGLTALPNNSKLATLLTRAITGTVTNAGLSPTATQFECSDITEATASHYVGLACYATSGNLNGQCIGVVTAYSLVSGRGRFTVSGSPSAEALANTDTVLFV